MKNSLARILATWFGCGYSPVAPGTVGAAAAVVIAYLLGWDRVTNGIAGVLVGLIGIVAATIEAQSAAERIPDTSSSMKWRDSGSHSRAQRHLTGRAI